MSMKRLGRAWLTPRTCTILFDYEATLQVWQMLARERKKAILAEDWKEILVCLFDFVFKIWQLDPFMQVNYERKPLLEMRD